MKVSTVIVTYNGMKWIDKCLKSIIDQSSVIIVDNNSSDNTVNFIHQKFPAAIVLAQNKNHGFGIANNIGISYAIQNGADAVFLLNQDVYAEPECLQHLVRAYELNPNFGIISPLHLNGNGVEVDKSFLNLTGPYSGSNIISDLILNQFSEKIYPLSFINAAAWFIPKQVFYDVGGFDPIFFMYGEDVNFCQRLLFHGFKIGILPDAIINHDSNNEFYKKRIEGSDEDLQGFRNSYLIKYLDVNTNNYKQAIRYKFYLLKMVFKAIFNFNFQRARVTFDKMKIIRNIKAKDNVETNRLSNSHYLEI